MEKTKIVIIGLSLTVILLLSIFAYTFWIQPAYKKFILDKQIEAYNTGILDSQKILLNGIKDYVNTYGYIQFRFEDNSTMFLAQFTPPQ